MSRKMSAAEFKNKCLRVMDLVKRTGKRVIVTKRGKPVVCIIPAADEQPEEELEGMIIHQDEDLFSTGEQWEADE